MLGNALAYTDRHVLSVQEAGVWRTIRGRKVFIRDGEDLKTALERSLKGSGQVTTPPRYLPPDWRDRFWRAHGKTWDPNTNKAATEASRRRATELTARHGSALTAFSTTRFRDINEVLRSGVAGKADTKSLIGTLDSAFSAVKPLKQDVMVFRGGFVNASTWKKYIEGGQEGKLYLQDPAFKATTAHEKTAYDFLNARLSGAVSTKKLTESKIRVRMEILVPKGTKAIPMVGFSSSPREQEILLNRTAKIRILAVDKKGPQLYKVSGVVE